MWAVIIISCTPLQTWPYAALILQMKKQRFREAKLPKSHSREASWTVCSTLKLCSWPSSKLGIWRWEHVMADFALATVTFRWSIPGDQGGCWGHRECAFRVSPQAQGWAHQGTTQAGNKRKSWAPAHRGRVEICEEEDLALKVIICTPEFRDPTNTQSRVNLN